MNGPRPLGNLQRRLPGAVQSQEYLPAQSMQACPESSDMTSSEYCSKPSLLDLISLTILNAFASSAMSVLGGKNKSPIMMNEPACAHDERREYALNRIFPKL